MAIPHPHNNHIITKMIQWLKNNYRNIAYLLLYLVMILIIVEVLGKKGLIGVIIGIIIYVAFRLYTGREQMLQGMRYIETIIFGKPLEKDYWKKGEIPKWKKIK